MKKLFKLLPTLFFVVLGTLFMAGGIAQATGWNPYAVASGLVVAGGVQHYIAPMLKGYAYDALTLTQIFTGQLTERLTLDNSFIGRSINDDAFVDAGETVKLPQRGAAPGVKRDRNTLPATIKKRVDTEIAYTLKEFTADPITVQRSEEIEVNYEKSSSIVEDFEIELREKAIDYILNEWLPAGGATAKTKKGQSLSIIKPTTGTDTRPAAQGTGTRKRIAKADFIGMQTLFNQLDVPMAGRHCLIPSEFLEDLLLIDGFVEADKIGSANLIQGQIGMLCGFNIFVRSTVARYSSNGGTKRELDEDGAFTGTANGDAAAALFWHERMVRRALGAISMFVNVGEATMYGDVISGMIRAGGKQKREDNVGVAALYEAT